jgi:DNA-binding NtrC family response regulator
VSPPVLSWISSRLAQCASPVLITGETGTGKEIAALAIHNQSGRKGAFVAVNCAALPDALAESELFGHVRGAFTGATTDRSGAFRDAHMGTLFLDEIGDAPRTLQAKLLRVLSNGGATPVGSSKPVASNVRLVCATNVDLAAAVASGAFRADLLHRIDVLRVALKPLRDRPAEEVETLARVLLLEINEELGTSCTLGDPRSLRFHDWPGNVRELRNALTRLAIEACAGPVVFAPAFALPRLEHSDPLIAEKLRAMRLCAEAVERHKGNKNRAAKELGINRTTLVERLKWYDNFNKEIRA